MNFCEKCGHQLSENAKFCAICGTPITSSTSNEATRKTFFDGEIHKCPNCGETLRSFETICPTCNFELRGAKGSNAVKDLAEKLERATSEKQKIIVIKNFPIPNTKEDIFEFMILASSNFDSSYYAAHLNEEDISDAWLSKIEQCYQKAKISFGAHSDFESIEKIYSDIKNSCEKEKIRFNNAAKKEKAKVFTYVVLLALGLILVMIPFIAVQIIGLVLSISSIVLLVKNKRKKAEERIKENILQARERKF